MSSSPAELDAAFQQHIHFIRERLEHDVTSKHDKIRVEKWISALSQPTKQVVWKRNRNNHSSALKDMMEWGTLEPPFTSLPPTPLQNFSSYLTRPKQLTSKLRTIPTPSEAALGEQNLSHQITHDEPWYSITPSSRPGSMNGSRLGGSAGPMERPRGSGGVRLVADSSLGAELRGDEPMMLTMSQILRMSQKELITRLVQEQSLRVHAQRMLKSYSKLYGPPTTAMQPTSTFPAPARTLWERPSSPSFAARDPSPPTFRPASTANYNSSSSSQTRTVPSQQRVSTSLSPRSRTPQPRERPPVKDVWSGPRMGIAGAKAGAFGVPAHSSLHDPARGTPSGVKGPMKAQRGGEGEEEFVSFLASFERDIVQLSERHAPPRASYL